MERKLSFDISKGIAIVFVVFVHALPNVDPAVPNFNNNAIVEFLYRYGLAFIMPLFFFASGYFSKKVSNFNNADAKIYLFKRFKRLMVPYISVSILGILVKILLSSYAIRDVNIGKMIFSTLFNPWSGSIRLLWFVYSLFIIDCIVVMTRKIPLKWCLIVTLILNVAPVNFGTLFNIDGIFQYLIFFYLGIWFNGYYTELYNYKYRSLICALSNICFCLLVFIQLDYGNPLYNSFAFISALIGICAYTTLSMIIDKYPVGKMTSKLGNESFNIYLFSWFFQSFARILFFQILHYNYYVSLFIMFIAGFLPILAVKIVSRVKFTRKYLLGVFD